MAGRGARFKGGPAKLSAYDLEYAEVAVHLEYVAAFTLAEIASGNSGVAVRGEGVCFDRHQA